MQFEFQGIKTNISEEHPDVKGKTAEELKEKNLLTGGTDEDYKRLHAELNPAVKSSKK